MEPRSPWFVSRVSPTPGEPLKSTLGVFLTSLRQKQDGQLEFNPAVLLCWVECVLHFAFALTKSSLVSDPGFCTHALPSARYPPQVNHLCPVRGATAVFDLRIRRNRVTRKSCLLIVRSPFRAKHHVVVQYMARWMKCPLPPPPKPHPPPLPHTQTPPTAIPPMDSAHDWWKTRRTRKN